VGRRITTQPAVLTNDAVREKVARRKDKELALKELIKWRKHLALE
jgi:hypothetical protein